MTNSFDRYLQIALEYSDTEERFIPNVIRGEYWFDESGYAIYADGDVGDMNHEAHVIQRCAGEVASMFNCELSDMDTYIETDSGIEQCIIETIIDELDEASEEMIDNIKNDPADAIGEYIKNKFNMSESDAYSLVMTAYGAVTDAREYAIEKWNWSRVHGSSIEVKMLTRKQLKLVADGIWNALEEEGRLYEDDERERAEKSLYDISTYTGKRYKITLEDMTEGNVAGLEQAVEVPVSAATQQIRNMDIDAMPDYYKQKGVIGDSTRFDNVYQSILESISAITIDNVYHGGHWDGRSPIKTTGRGSLGMGAYFTPDENRAAQYAQDSNGKVIKAQLSITNPLKIYTNSTQHQHPCVLALTELGMDKLAANKLVERVEEQKGYLGKEISSRAIAQGFDSIVQYYNGKITEIVIWDSRKVHATEN
jgi:hypothetical protein